MVGRLKRRRGYWDRGSRGGFSTIEEEERGRINVHRSLKTTVYTGSEVLLVHQMAVRRRGLHCEWSRAPCSQTLVFVLRAAWNTEGSKHVNGRIRVVFQKAQLIHGMLQFSFCLGLG